MPSATARPHVHSFRGWTPRQREVLDLLAKGSTNWDIAQALDVSLDGAKWHVSQVMAKLEVESREEAAEAWRDRSTWAPAWLRAFTGGLAFRIALITSVAAGASALAIVAVLALLARDGGTMPLPSPPAAQIVAPGSVPVAPPASEIVQSPFARQEIGGACPVANTEACVVALDLLDGFRARDPGRILDYGVPGPVYCASSPASPVCEGPAPGQQQAYEAGVLGGGLAAVNEDQVRGTIAWAIGRVVPGIWDTYGSGDFAVASIGCPLDDADIPDCTIGFDVALTYNTDAAASQHRAVFLLRFLYGEAGLPGLRSVFTGAALDTVMTGGVQVLGGITPLGMRPTAFIAWNPAANGP